MLRWFNSQARQNNNIIFADDDVKRIMVANFDTTGDGEISYAEAAVVTSIGILLQSNTSIISFDELQYFSGITELDEPCFSRCTKLSSIIIPDSVTYIGTSCFYYCTSLVSIDIPNSVTDLGVSCFHKCTHLASIEIPNSITLIPGKCFYDNTALETVIIPSSVTNFADFAFKGVSGDVLIYNEDVITIKYSSFYGSTSNIYVPDDSLAAYKAATYWSSIASRIFPLSDYSG